MKSQDKKDVSEEYFRPLKNYRYNPFFHPSVATNKQIVLAKNLHRSYGIAESNILRLIMYTDFVLKYSTESEIQIYYSDLREIADFDEKPEPILKIVFYGETKSFEITNMHLIDEIYKSMLNLIDFHKIIKNKVSRQKRTSEAIIRKVANELFKELTQVERISEWRSFCIIGYIFYLYSISLNSEEPILSEEKYNQIKKEKVLSGTYLQYLAGRIKRYISN